jgi:hypothetical protein
LDDGLVVELIEGMGMIRIVDGVYAVVHRQAAVAEHDLDPEIEKANAAVELVLDLFMFWVTETLA